METTCHHTKTLVHDETTNSPKAARCRPSSEKKVMTNQNRLPEEMEMVDIKSQITAEEKSGKAKTGDVGEPTLNSELAHGSIDGNDDGSSQLAADNDFEERIIDFYKNNNPSKLSDLPELLEKYRGREEVLLSY